MPALPMPKALQLAKKSGAWFSMDIYNDDYILAEGAKNGVFAESLEKERQIGRAQRETFRAAYKAGVKMVFGSDAGVYPHGDNGRQFAKMVEWGMTPYGRRSRRRRSTPVRRWAGQRTSAPSGRPLCRYHRSGRRPDQRCDDCCSRFPVVIKGGTMVKDAR